MPMYRVQCLFISVTVVVIFQCHFATSFTDYSCKWTFQSCDFKSRFFIRKCLVTEVKRKNDILCQPHKQRTIRLNWQYHRYCSPKRCEIIPAWCPWSSWIGSKAECGYESGKLFSSRELCCHPVTREPLTVNRHRICRNPIHKQSRFQQKEWYSCPEPTDSTGVGRIDTFVWTVAGVISTVVIVASIITLLYYMRYRRLRNSRNRTRRRPCRHISSERRDNVPSAPELNSPHTSIEHAGSRRLIQHNNSQPPPSYEETQANMLETTPTSAPPQYDIALKLAI